MEAATSLPLPLPLPFARTRLHLGALLVRDGLLEAEQLEAALVEKEKSGRRLDEIVIQHGWVDAAALARALAEQHELDFLDIARTELDATAVGLLPEKFARRYGALPIRFLAEDTVLVAVDDPTNVVTSDDLRLALGLNVRFAVVAADDLQKTIGRVYRTSRLKIMGELDIADRRGPQDGRVSIRFGGAPMDLRIAVLPTTWGEQVVLRIMQRAGGRLGISQLGMSPGAEESSSRAGCARSCAPTRTCYSSVRSATTRRRTSRSRPR